MVAELDYSSDTASYPGALVCLRAHVGRHAREKNGKFVGKRLVEFAFKMAGQCSASVLYYLYYY